MPTVHRKMEIKDVEPGMKVNWLFNDVEILNKKVEVNPSDNREYVMLFYSGDSAITDLPYGEVEVAVETRYHKGEYVGLWWANKERWGRVVAFSDDLSEALVRLNYCTYPNTKYETEEVRYFALNNDGSVEKRTELRRLRNYRPHDLPKKWAAKLED